MKILMTVFCLAGSFAHANPYYDRLRQVEAQEQAQGRAQAQHTEAIATQKLQASIQHMAAAQGGLVSSSVNVTLIGNTLIMGGEMSFTTGNNMVCNPIMGNIQCLDASCSNAKFWVINCIDAGGVRCKLDQNGRRYPWPTYADIIGHYKRPHRR